jgi:hypothetical protein
MAQVRSIWRKITQISSPKRKANANLARIKAPLEQQKAF